MTTLIEVSNNGLKTHEPALSLGISLSVTDHLASIITEGRAVTSYRVALTNSIMEAPGQILYNICGEGSSRSRYSLDILEGNELPISYSSIPLGTQQSWQESYRLSDLGKTVVMISYQHEPYEARVDATGLTTGYAYEGLIKEACVNWFYPKITPVDKVDSTSVLNQTIHSRMSAPDYEKLTNRLWAAFDSEVLEDGMDHPAEQIIDDAVNTLAGQLIYPWFKTLALDVEQPSFASSVLRCLGRLPDIGTIEWRVDLVKDALKVQDVEIRDAAVQTVESWGDRSLVEVIRKHTDSEPWLQEYIQDVIDDLGE